MPAMVIAVTPAEKRQIRLNWLPSWRTLSPADDPPARRARRKRVGETHSSLPQQQGRHAGRHEREHEHGAAASKRRQSDVERAGYHDALGAHQGALIELSRPASGNHQAYQHHGVSEIVEGERL